ncbi:phosphatase PAP2 family protein [Oceanotoga sp. DSM 15011]|uniref:PAP2 superfamily protein n=1 Tax=Oceanotoga teriensis TaxID=515440 RepID=A0AA45C4L2_9BACT|nr:MULTISPECIES: phosphatase PAP2 family protein [Oceanotoga]MDN5343590.1 hypothetical protein [Oceanotoga sp.]PWJ86738.1 PAP2 superfamily protein [Oceanotoga teriensis]UYP00462.1 phosphatase PAP2 family protein [Oceanotoga sp. DSM 15011]
MKNKFFLILFLVLFLTSFSNINSDLKININVNDDYTFLKEEIFTFSSISLGTFIFDESIRNFNESINIKFPSIESITDEKVLLGGNSTIFFYSIFSKDKKLQRVSLESFQKAFFAGSIAYASKIFFGRARPYLELGHNNFDFFNFNYNFHSFPSGHSTVSWALLTPYAENYNKAFYIIPAFISISRIIEDKHWTSDVIIGSALGFFIGKYLPYFEFSF